MSTPNKRTYLASPGYGHQTAAAGRGVWRARRDMDNVFVGHLNSSLLAATFNGLWCSALNEATEKGLAYFAMLHDDIGPEDFWLDKLIDELETHDLDVLGVASPIKDQRGLTSLAIDGETTWRPRCRITSKELLSLPPTFTSDDIGGSLLLNTGCWVCRFDLEWCRKVHFTINDRIVFNESTGRYLAECEPEDWYFSRLCHELKLRIGATRKVSLMHRGEIDFYNNDAYGNSFDAEYSDESFVKQQFPFDVPGWLTPDEGQMLSKYAEGKRVLEIGSYMGRSTVCLARSAESITCVDYFDGRGTATEIDTLDAFKSTLSRYGVSDKVETCHPDDQLPMKCFDVVFIDGAHDVDSVRTDIAKAIDSLKPDGLILFHDYQDAENEISQTFDAGVTQAVHELLDSGATIVERCDTLAVIRPPIPVFN